MASEEPDAARDVDGASDGESTSALAEARDPAASGDVLAKAVDAVSALYGVDEPNAKSALGQVATRHHVSVHDVARAVLILIAGTDEPLGDGVGRAAAQLLGQGVTTSS